MSVTADEFHARVQNIDPYEFEEFVAELLEREGWETEVSQGSNDMGVDVVAEKSDGIVETKMAVQVKRYSEDNKIGRPEVQKYHSMKEQDSKVDSAAIVTTSSFTSEAEEWGSNHNVKLIDGDDLLGLVQNQDSYELLNQYAPALSTSSVDPKDTPSRAEKNDIETPVEAEVETALPEPFHTEENRKMAGGAFAVGGILLILNPTGMTLPVEAIGALLLVAAAGVVMFPEEIHDAMTPDETVYREFSNGGLLVEVDGETQYRYPDSQAQPKVFDTFDDDSLSRQQANLYGILRQRYGDFQELDRGSIPTEIVTDGQSSIIAYRFAVQDEKPEEIASEMNVTQQEVVDTLSELAE
jgi:hypothetical protein